MEKERRVNLLSFIILAGFLLAVVFYYWQGVYHGLPYPHNTFLFIPSDRFNDFNHMYNLTRHLNPYFEPYRFQSNYYPFANFVFYLFTLIPAQPYVLIIFSGLFVIAFLILIAFNLRTSHGINWVSVLIIGCLTYPFLMILDRANIEGLLFISLFLFLYFFQQRRYGISTIFLACAIAMKVYPAVLIILYLPEKRYKEVIWTGIEAGVISLATLAMFKGGFANNLQFILSGFGVNDTVFFENNNRALAGLGLFSTIKVYLIETNQINAVNIQSLLSVYTRLVLAGFGLIVLYVIFIEKELWKQVALLVFAMLILPHVSFDYKLIHVFLPLLILLNVQGQQRMHILYLVLFGLLLIPKNYVLFQHALSNSGAPDISIATVINPAMMLVMMLLLMGEGLVSWLKARLTRTSETLGEKVEGGSSELPDNSLAGPAE